MQRVFNWRTVAKVFSPGQRCDSIVGRKIFFFFRMSIRLPEMWERIFHPAAGLALWGFAVFAGRIQALGATQA
jgi:hypothetical protein